MLSIKGNHCSWDYLHLMINKTIIRFNRLLLLIYGARMKTSHNFERNSQRDSRVISITRACTYVPLTYFKKYMECLLRNSVYFIFPLLFLDMFIRVNNKLRGRRAIYNIHMNNICKMLGRYWYPEQSFIK